MLLDEQSRETRDISSDDDLINADFDPMLFRIVNMVNELPTTSPHLKEKKSYFNTVLNNAERINSLDQFRFSVIYLIESQSLP